MITLIILISFQTELFSQWNQITAYGGGATYGAFSFVINGTAYVGGGASSQNFYQFDPANNKWIQKANFGGSGRDWPFAFTINGKGYVGGGDPTGQFTTLLNDFWEYNPATDIWTKKGDFPGAARDVPFTFVINGIAYVGGGFGANMTDLSDCWQYDSSTDSWTQIVNYPFACADPTAFVINNVAYISGGGYKNCYKFDPATKVFSAIADFPGDLRGPGLTLSVNGKGYVGLGENASFTTTYTDIWEYDPMKDQWKQRTDMIYPNTFSAFTTAFALDSDIYVGTGVNFASNQMTNQFYKFTLGSTLSSVEDVFPNEFNIYPNPAEDYLYVNTSEGQEIFIFNSEGNIVIETKYSGKIDIKGLENGIYFIRIDGKVNKFLVCR